MPEHLVLDGFDTVLSMSSSSDGQSDNLAARSRNRKATRHSITSNQCPTYQPRTFFQPPAFGVTVLGNSHGFDKEGSVSGYVLWINGRGIMIDPPPYSTATLEREGLRSNMIVGIILTHCHADHDAGAFQKVRTTTSVLALPFYFYA